MELVSNIKIESGILPPPINMTSPWTHIAYSMKVGDSILLNKYDDVLKIKYALLRLGFLSVRRRIDADSWRIWKVERSFAKKRGKKIPKCVLYSNQTRLVIAAAAKEKKK
jgi:hypothetical protein